MKDFEGFVAAFLPGLVYFEFKMVNSRTRRIFTELFQGELFKVLDFKNLYLKILFQVISMYTNKSRKSSLLYITYGGRRLYQYNKNDFLFEF